MKLKVINTGSIGNCYILENDTTALVIECGVKFSEIKQALNFNLEKVAGVLISHEHQDHCKAIKDVAAAGLDFYASTGTLEAMKMEGHHRANKLHNLNPKRIGAFNVMPFDVKHDAKEPMGFMINHVDCGNVLFLTDTYYTKYTFKELNNVIIEANFCQKIVDARLKEKNIHSKVRDRVLESHMSIDTCIQTLKANDLKQVHNIVLIHLSDGNSNEKDFKQRVKDATGKVVSVASKGMEIPFERSPF